MTSFQSHAGRALAAATAAGDDVLLTDDDGSVTGVAFAGEVCRLAWTLADLAGRGQPDAGDVRVALDCRGVARWAA